MLRHIIELTGSRRPWLISTIRLWLLLTVGASQAHGDAAHEHAYTKPGAPIVISTPQQIAVAPHTPTQIEVGFAVGERAEVLTVTAAVRAGLELLGAPAQWQFRAGEPMIIPLQVLAHRSGLHPLVFTATIRTGEHRATRVLGIALDAREPGEQSTPTQTLEQQKATASQQGEAAVISLPAQERISP